MNTGFQWNFLIFIIHRMIALLPFVSNVMENQEDFMEKKTLKCHSFYCTKKDLSPILTSFLFSAFTLCDVVVVCFIWAATISSIVSSYSSFFLFSLSLAPFHSYLVTYEASNHYKFMASTLVPHSHMLKIEPTQ